MKFLHTALAVFLSLASGASSAGICRSALVPAYYGPDTSRCTGWGSFATHTPMQWIVANPANGVGSAPIYECQYEIAYQQQVLTNNVAGYVATGYGARPIEEVKEEVWRWATWYCITGIFFDEVSTNRGFTRYYQELLDYVALVLPHSRIFLNHGEVPDEAYLRLKEKNYTHVTNVIFEGSGAAYLSFVEPDWVTKYDTSKLAHLVYDTQFGDLAPVLGKAGTAHAEYVLITDDFQSWDGAKWDLNPWDTMPSYWYDLVAGLSCASQ